MRQIFFICATVWLFGLAGPVFAQTAAEPSSSASQNGSIDARQLGGQDLARKLGAIYDAIPGLAGVEVQVDLGVVRLSGTVATPEHATAAREVASRFQGVVQVVGEPQV